MNVASLDNCKRLYDVSKWGETATYWNILNDNPTLKLNPSFDNPSYPAYDLGYLIRKLPIQTRLYQTRKGWTIGRYGFRSISTEKTPEDAACLLAILLFEEGILK